MERLYPYLSEYVTELHGVNAVAFAVCTANKLVVKLLPVVTYFLSVRDLKIILYLKYLLHNTLDLYKETYTRFAPNSPIQIKLA